MEGQVESQRNNGREVLDLPVGGSESTEVDHATNHEGDEDVHVLEGLEDTGHLLEEVGLLLLLGSGTPLHVDVEEVAQESHRDVEGKTTEEASHHRRPLEVLNEGAQEGSLASTVAEESEGDVTKSVEHNNQRQEDFPGGEVARCEVVAEPSDEEVVEHREHQSRAKSEVRAHVGENRQLRGQHDVGAEESVEERSERALVDPAVQRVEDHLADTVSVLLPAGNLVVDGQRDTLLKALAVVRSNTNDVALHLESQGDIEILRHVVLRPVASVSLILDNTDILDSYNGC